MGKTIKSGKTKKAQLAAEKKQRQEERDKERIKEAVAMQQKEGQRQILEKLMEFFQAHPSEASFMLANINSGYFDFESNTQNASEVRLPGHMNKVGLLSKEVCLELLTEIRPELSEWLSSTILARVSEGQKERHLGKKELNQVLGFLAGMDPTSALPCKALTRLKRKMRERYEALGRRAESFQVGPDKTLED